MPYKFNPLTGQFDYYEAGVTTLDGLTNVIISSPANDEVLTYENGDWKNKTVSTGATIELDNLGTVAINTSLISDTDSTDDLGSSAKYWANAYVDKVRLDSNTRIYGDDGAIYFEDSTGKTFWIDISDGSAAIINGYHAIIKSSDHFAPLVDSNRDLGTSALYWAETYTDKLFLNSTAILDGATAGITNVTGNIGIRSNAELRLYDNGNYVGFEAPALTSDQIWVLPTADGKDGDVLTTNGSGGLSWLSGASEKSWAFRSRSGASGTTYTGGFYEHSGAANDFGAGPTFGTANASRAAHFFVVTGANTVDELTIRVSGTSILDTGASRATSSVEDIVIPNATAAGAYYETTKKWLGTVTITVFSGTAKICDFGFAKYWDNNNTDFAVVGMEMTWLGGATDTAPNLILRHHKGTSGNTDWTYTGSGATPPTAIAAMATDHSTVEDNIINGENGAWKRDDLSVNISGSGKEGTILEIITTANRAFELGNFLLRITPQ